jgi:predicted ATPase
MLALYRCGRQPEALHHYENYRRRLGEETGLEPGFALAELENGILTGEPELAAPASTARAVHTNLPQRLSSFVGRKRELTQLAQRLAEHRLVTLVGAGGIGKTSLGLRAAGDMPVAFPDGIWWIDLGPINDASLIGGTAAAVIGAELGPRRDPLGVVTTHLRNWVTLLVLDNCEHIIEGTAHFAHSVLGAAPDVSILATSREPLGVAGEALMKVPPLSLPEDGDIATSEAVRLFVDRARLLDSDFALDDANSEHVATICQQLDGIPLAIELAAARMSTMALDHIAAGIDDRYELLTRGARTAPRRHQTLRAMVDWSHDLLTEQERIVFRRLAAFAGTFTAAGAAFVCGFEPLRPDDVTLCLDQLVDASLVDPHEPTSDRFRMLETIRQYAQRHLDASEGTAAVMPRLADYLNKHGPASEEGYPVSDYEAWYRWRDAERDNYRAVLAWALAARDKDVAASTAMEFRSYLAVQNLADETVAVVNGVLELLGDEMSHRHLRLFSFAVINEVFLGDRGKAQSMTEELKKRAHLLGEEGVMGWALQLQCIEHLRCGNLEAALDLNAQAIIHLRAADDLRTTDQMWMRSFILTRVGRFGEARTVLDEMLATARRMGERCDNRYAEASWNIGRAIVAAYEGNASEAERLLDLEDEYVHHLGPDDLLSYSWGRWQMAFLDNDPAQAEAVAKELDQATPSSAGPDRQRDIAYMRALPALALRGPDGARPHLRNALHLARKDGAVIDSAEIVSVVAETALMNEDFEVAAILFAAAGRILDPSRIVVSPWQRSRIDESIEQLRTITDPAQLDHDWNRGAAMTPDEMVAYASDYVGLEPSPPSD